MFINQRPNVDPQFSAWKKIQEYFEQYEAEVLLSDTVRGNLISFITSVNI